MKKLFSIVVSFIVLASISSVFVLGDATCGSGYYNKGSLDTLSWTECKNTCPGGPSAISGFCCCPAGSGVGCTSQFDCTSVHGSGWYCKDSQCVETDKTDCGKDCPAGTECRFNGETGKDECLPPLEAGGVPEFTFIGAGIAGVAGLGYLAFRRFRKK